MEVTYASPNNNIHTSVKTFISPRKRTANDIDIFNEYPKPSNYTETLLREYRILVELLARLDDETFHALYPEVNSAVDILKDWLNTSNATNTLDIYWTMRQLRRKIHNQIKHSNRSMVKPLINSNFVLSAAGN